MIKSRLQVVVFFFVFLTAAQALGQTTTTLRNMEFRKLADFTTQQVDGHTLGNLGWMACNESGTCVAMCQFDYSQSTRQYGYIGLYRFTVSGDNNVAWQLVTDDPVIVGNSARVGILRGDDIAVLPDGTILANFDKPAPGYYIIGLDNQIRPLLVSGQMTSAGMTGGVFSARGAADGSIAIIAGIGGNNSVTEYRNGQLFPLVSWGPGSKLVNIGSPNKDFGFGYGQAWDTQNLFPAALDLSTGKTIDLATFPLRVDGSDYTLGQDNRPSDPLSAGLQYHAIAAMASGALFVATKPSVTVPGLNSFGADLIYCATAPVGCRKAVDSFVPGYPTSPLTPIIDIRCIGNGACAFNTRSSSNPEAGYNQDLFLVKIGANGSIVSQAVALWNDRLFPGDERDLMISTYGHVLSDGRIVFYRYGQHGSYLVVATPPPALTTDSVVDTAKGQNPGMVAPGQIVSIYGLSLSAGTAAGLPQGLPAALPTQLLATRVTFNGIDCQLYYVSSGQINFVVPNSAPLGSGQIIVRNGSLASQTVTVTVRGTNLSIFDAGSDSAVVHMDGSVVTAQNPARSGEAVTIYASGVGQTVRQNGIEFCTEPISVTFAGTSGNVLFAGISPQYPGLGQINVIVPQVQATTPVELKVVNTTSSFSAKLSISR